MILDRCSEGISSHSMSSESIELPYLVITGAGSNMGRGLLPFILAPLSINTSFVLIFDYFGVSHR